MLQSPDQSLRVYHLFEPALQEGRPQTYDILLREVRQWELYMYMYLNYALRQVSFSSTGHRHFVSKTVI